MRGDVDQRRAIVEWDDFHPRRQCAVAVYPFDLTHNSRHHVVGVQRSVHHQNGGDYVVFVVASGLAEPRHIADIDLRHVLDLDGHAVRLRQRNVLDIVDLVAFGQVDGSAAVDQADAAHIDRLLAEIDGAAADIDVRIPDRGDHLGQGDAVGVELVQIDFDLVFLGGSAPGVDLDDARHRQEAALQHPVLDGAQIGQPEVRRPDHLVAIDFAHQARCLDLGQHVIRKIDVLLQIQCRLGDGEVIVDAVSEGDANERQSVEGGRADDVDAGRRGKSDFHGNGVVPLHLLGGLARGLRGDLENHRRGVRIGLDVELGEGDEPGADEDDHAENNDRTARQSEYDQALEHDITSYHHALHRPFTRGQREAIARALLRNRAPSEATSSPAWTPSRIWM